MSQNILHFRLSHDELAWLQFTLLIPPMVGMGKTLYPDVKTEEVAQARLAAGLAGLRARGLVQTGEDGGLKIDVIVSGVLGAYALAQQALVLSSDLPDNTPQLYVYYFSPKLCIEHHYAVEQGVHEFTATNERELLVRRMVERLQVPSLNGVEGSFSISLDQFNRLAELIKTEQITDAQRLLTEAGLQPQDAAYMVNVIGGQGGKHSVIFLRAEGEGAQRQLNTDRSFALFRHENDVLRMTFSGQTVTIDPSSGEELYQTLLHEVQ